MIPRPSILAWEHEEAPWTEDWQIEHDLMMSRVLIEIFSHQELSERLIFRGGTALGKLHFSPTHRFSEDLDLVQLKPGPIKETVQYPLLHEVMEDLPLEHAKFDSSERGYSYFFDFDVVDRNVEKSRLKIEINTREHFTLLDPEHQVHRVSTDWFEGKTRVRTYQLTEMMAHKLISLYDRKKGRDLFDLWYVTCENLVSPENVLSCYEEYVKKTRDAGQISRAEFEQNLSGKMKDPTFREDVNPLLRPEIDYDINEAINLIHEQYIESMKGEPYKGEDNYFENGTNE